MGHPVLLTPKHNWFDIKFFNYSYATANMNALQSMWVNTESTLYTLQHSGAFCEYSKRKNTSIHSSSLEKPELDQSETYYIWGEHTDFFHVLFFSVLFTSKSSSYFFFFWKQDHYMTYGPIIYAFQPISMMLKIDLVI